MPPLRRSQPLPGWITVPLLAAVFLGLTYLERKRPLRRSVESKLRRDARNIALGGIGAVAVALAEQPLAAPLSALVERRDWGLLPRLRLPLWLEVTAAVLAMDYTMYLWHRMNHRAPWLWRFHAVHHVDLDMDASTAIRFHFGELTASAPFRAAQVLIIGVTPLALSVWQTAFLASILFHHSNVRLPIRVEQRLTRFLVTPRMHGIHHSAVHEETDSNWSSGLSIWDRLHGTLRLDILQDRIVIGVPAYRDPAEVTLPKILAMPFEEQRPLWDPPCASPSR
jgi:sterol desaturase/sphingolipid hydroxylase (fatty acid hydroxylase superfamily)